LAEHHCGAKGLESLVNAAFSDGGDVGRVITLRRRVRAPILGRRIARCAVELQEIDEPKNGVRRIARPSLQLRLAPDIDALWPVPDGLHDRQEIGLRLVMLSGRVAGHNLRRPRWPAAVKVLRVCRWEHQAAK
jgi:hypothetical protein